MLVDALGWVFAERFAERAPLLARLRAEGVVSKLTTQFPSTTTAHVTTLHTTQAVGEHGAYEWFVYEPSLDRIVCPLTAAFAGEERGGLMAAGADLRAVYPQADGLAAASPGWARRAPRAAGGDRGNAVHPARGRSGERARLCVRARGRGLAARLARAAAPSLTVLYLDDFDDRAHEIGPDDPRAEAVAVALLEAVEHELVDALARDAGGAGAGVRRPRPAADRSGALRLRQRALSAARAAPASGADGRPLAPAGSARDLFLHVRTGALEEAAGLLRELFGDDAWVVASGELAAEGVFGPTGVCSASASASATSSCCPAPASRPGGASRAASSRTSAGTTAGCEPAEAETWLGALVP